MTENQKKDQKVSRNWTPKNYGDLFPSAKTDSVSFFEKNFITFKAYSSPSINYLATSTQGANRPGKLLEEFSFFYPKDSIREQVTHNYGALEGGYADLLKLGKSTEIQFAKGLTAAKNIISKGSRVILDEEPAYFLHTNKRRFDIILDLYTTTNTQEDVYEPVLFFKRNSHAVNPNTLGNITVVSQPGTFRIVGGLFNHPAMRPVADSRGHLVLIDMTIEYNPDIKFIDSLGLPVQARLSLTFEELQSLFGSDWSGGQLKTSVE